MNALLEIPKFLLRKRKRGRPRKIKEPSLNLDTHIVWDKIKQKKYGIRYDMQLGDIFRRIGTGLRIIYVEEKRKWVFIVGQSGNPFTTQPIRIRMSKRKWENIKRNHEKYMERNKKYFERIKDGSGKISKIKRRTKRSRKRSTSSCMA